MPLHEKRGSAVGRQPEKREPAGVSIVTRVMTLLGAVVHGAGRLSIAELAAATGLPKPTVHRLCQQLESEGYLQRDLGSRQFAVGDRLWSLGLDVINSGGHPERRALLQRLVNEIGETCNLATRMSDQSIYIDRVESHWPLQLNLRPGSLVPLHCTASGKLFLSAMRRAQRQSLLAIKGMPAHTSKTITDLDRMEKEVELIKARGYSIDDEEFLEGLVALSVPVYNSQGAIVAGIACHGPKPRLSLERALSHLPALRAAADALSTILTDSATSKPEPAAPAAALAPPREKTPRRT